MPRYYTLLGAQLTGRDQRQVLVAMNGTGCGMPGDA